MLCWDTMKRALRALCYIADECVLLLQHCAEKPFTFQHPMQRGIHHITVPGMHSSFINIIMHEMAHMLAIPANFSPALFKCLQIGGESNLASGIQVAQLALKHRQNKNQQQRIIVLAGSPIKHDMKMLETIGRKLKKNSVALDVVDFGECDDGKSERLGALITAANNNGNSHMVNVPPGSSALSDVLLSTPIFTGDGDGGSGFVAATAAASAGSVSGFEFGVDPNLDPELALALRVSMEEERARQEVAAKRASEDAVKQEKEGMQASGSQDAVMAEPVSTSAPSTDDRRHDLMDDETALLEQALAMSMNDARPDSIIVGDTDMADVAGDQELAPALQMSVQEKVKDSSNQSDMTRVLEDQSFVSSILNSLPGVDPNDPSVKDLFASLQSQTEQKQNEKTEEEGEK